MLHQFLPLQVTYFRALPHSLGYIFQYIFLSLMILNIMHHVHDCNRVLEVRRGLVVSIVLFPPTSLKDRVIKALELCSCGKEKKKKKEKYELSLDIKISISVKKLDQAPLSNGKKTGHLSCAD